MPVEELFLFFSECLSSVWTRKRSPNHILDSVNQARLAQDSTTSKIFFDNGFQAWVAYFVLKPGSATINGKVARCKLFASLDNLSAEERANLARRVNAVTPHPTVASLIQSMQQQIQQSVPGAVSSKRRRKYPT